MVVWNGDTEFDRRGVDDVGLEPGPANDWFRLCNSKCLENPATREDCTVVYPARKGHGSIQ